MRKDIKKIEKYCAYCGKKLERKRFPNGRLEDFTVFLKRKYCNRECMRKAFLKIGFTTQSKSSAHETSRNIFKIFPKEKKCAICGKTTGAIDIHHIDHNYNNNNLQNLEYLCRSCHSKQHRKKQTCKICGKPMKGLEYCNKHYIRFKKYGNPLYHKNKVEEE